MNYSSDGSRLAVASNDCKIYIYATRDNFARVSLVTGHQSFVTQVDFSTDATYLQSADGARALMFADTATGVQIPSESQGSAASDSRSLMGFHPAQACISIGKRPLSSTGNIYFRVLGPLDASSNNGTSVPYVLPPCMEAFFSGETHPPNACASSHR